MKRKTSLITILILLLAFYFVPATQIFAEDEYNELNIVADEYIEIRDAADLLNIRNNPNGKYILTADIDMEIYSWAPFEFGGELKGNGHSILNLKITECGSETRLTYDGNRKKYETCFAGLFSVLSGTVEDLTLINERINITTDTHCFTGNIAGYLENGTISNCNIAGGESFLTADTKMWGSGGIIGYGYGFITDTIMSSTIICVDLNKEEKDEQFLGGAFAAGYPNVTGCILNMDAYLSDFGYVHSGGVGGMFILYPKTFEYTSTIKKNNVTGKIHFFEGNDDPRAYCKTLVGEIMNWTPGISWGGISYDGTYIKKWNDRSVDDQHTDYSETLLPHMCSCAEYEKTLVWPTLSEYGYTLYKCTECDYSYKDNFKIYKKPSPIPFWKNQPKRHFDMY